MCKYKPVHGETANGSLNQLCSLDCYKVWTTVVILELIHPKKALILHEKNGIKQFTCIHFKRCRILACNTTLFNVNNDTKRSDFRQSVYKYH